MLLVEEQISNYERRIENIRTLWSKGEISDYDYEKAVSTIEEKIAKLRTKPTQSSIQISPRPTYENKSIITETEVLSKRSTGIMVMGGVLMVIGFILLLYEFYIINQFKPSLETSTRQVSALFGFVFAIVGFVIAIYGATSRGEEKGRMVR